jgi:hypothetical protein
MSYVNEFINYLKYLFKLILNYKEQLLENKRLKIVKELEKITEKQYKKYLDEEDKLILNIIQIKKENELKDIIGKQYRLLENKKLKIVKELEKQLNLDENNKRLNKKKELKEIKEKQYRFNLSEEDGILFDKIGYLQFTLLEDEHFRLSNLF